MATPARESSRRPEGVTSKESKERKKVKEPPPFPTKWYHGTPISNAISIQRHGFMPSSDGTLGKGVYVTGSSRQALAWGMRLAASVVNGGAALRVEVDWGRRLDLTTDMLKRKPWLSTTWSRDYDSCYLIPKSRDVAEEACILDPSRVKIVSVKFGKNGAALNAGYFIKDGLIMEEAEVQPQEAERMRLRQAQKDAQKKAEKKEEAVRRASARRAKSSSRNRRKKEAGGRSSSVRPPRAVAATPAPVRAEGAGCEEAFHPRCSSTIAVDGDVMSSLLSAQPLQALAHEDAAFQVSDKEVYDEYGNAYGADRLPCSPYPDDLGTSDEEACNAYMAALHGRHRRKDKPYESESDPEDWFALVNKATPPTRFSV
eukprot:TRINITY_DN101544_c0_g1_i1.p1 TRINITY_DN101544_c0_g1~~TRINITY_DN101544_c0_g1_i1.p1  ORF type:complete len:385 (+),score=73.94 TRINITY_DN101544_c0_g1_i1:44-1156(+)